MRDAYGPMARGSDPDLNMVAKSDLFWVAFASAHRIRGLMKRPVDSKRHPFVHKFRREIRRQLLRTHMESLNLALDTLLR